MKLRESLSIFIKYSTTETRITIKVYHVVNFPSFRCAASVEALRLLRKPKRATARYFQDDLVSNSTLFKISKTVCQFCDSVMHISDFLPWFIRWFPANKSNVTRKTDSSVH